MIHRLDAHICKKAYAFPRDRTIFLKTFYLSKSQFKVFACMLGNCSNITGVLPLNVGENVDCIGQSYWILNSLAVRQSIFLDNAGKKNKKKLGTRIYCNGLSSGSTSLKSEQFLVCRRSTHFSSH